MATNSSSSEVVVVSIAKTREEITKTLLRVSPLEKHGDFEKLRGYESLTPQDAKQFQEFTKVDWASIQTAVTRLFQLKRYPDLASELGTLNSKLSMLSQSEVGQFIGEFYQDQILTKCMIILRQEIVEERGNSLLQKLADIWTQFYTSILPTLQAIFVPVQLKFLSVRALTLISFRDIVLLKTSISEALQDDPPVPPQIKQMLLVLQSVHRNPPSEQFFQLQNLVGKVVQPYLCMVTRTRSTARAPSEPAIEENSRSYRAETVADVLDSPLLKRGSSVQRRHSIGHIDKDNEKGEGKK